MRKFKSFTEFALFTVEEDIEVARICLSTSKQGNTKCCYGMSALVLLGAAIDIIGTFYVNGFNIQGRDVEGNNLGRARDHFLAFYTKFCSSDCTQEQFMSSVYELARCRATHNGVLGKRVKISINSSPSGKFINIKRYNGKDYTTIHLNELLLFVKNSYDTMCAENKMEKDAEKFAPTTGLCADFKIVQNA